MRVCPLLSVCVGWMVVRCLCLCALSVVSVVSVHCVVLRVIREGAICLFCCSFSNISLVARASDSLGLSRFYTFGGHYRGGVRGSLLSCLARPLHANASLRLADMCGGACALSGAVWRVAGAYPATCLGWAEW